MSESKYTWHHDAIKAMAKKTDHAFLMRWGDWAKIGYADPSSVPLGVKGPSRDEVAIILGYIMGVEETFDDLATRPTS